MSRVEKTVFLSYRRIDRFAALLVFKDLTEHGYDVFIDYDGIASGDFERAIVDNIKGRAHFVLLLTPSALDRSSDPADWLRREIETAIAAQRNIVPLLLNGCDLGAPALSEKLVGSLAPLKRYQALEVPDSFFDEAMDRLRRRYLAVPVDAVLHPPSPHARQVAWQQQQAAASAPDVTSAAVDKSFPPATAATESSSVGASSNAGIAQTPAHHMNLSTWRWAIGIGGVALALFAWWYVSVPALQGTPAAHEHASSASATTGSLDLAALNKRAADYYSGPSRPLEEEEAVRLWWMSAEKGDSTAQSNLGHMYKNGRGGLPKSDAEAVKWYRKSAEQGNPLGQVNLGVMNRTGLGLPKNDAEAAKWYRLAAEQGNPIGQLNLGALYELGAGVPQSDVNAVKWYRKSAESGDADAQLYLGIMYEEGRGALAKSASEAAKWYRKSAAQGNADAKMKLAEEASRKVPSAR